MDQTDTIWHPTDNRLDTSPIYHIRCTFAHTNSHIFQQLSKMSCHHAFPLVSAVAFACLFPIASECVPSDYSAQQQMLMTIDPSSMVGFLLPWSSHYLIHTFYPFLWSWDVTNPHLFQLWHKLIGYWLVVMLLGSSQRSSPVRQLVTPNLPASTSCTQSTSSFQTSLSNEVLLFQIKSSFISCPRILQYAPVLSGTITIPSRT